MEAEGFHSISKRSSRDKYEEDADGKQVGSAGGIRHLQNVSSRIFTVSRASGSKDRHSKVLTAKGLRDRRIRLSVSTAIQFYDLQDRLGYEQPSKAVDWLIKAADSAIAELPELNASFPAPPPTALPGRAKLPEKAAADEQQPSLSKSTCSSTSETSKGSVLSLSRCESRVKTQGHHNVNTQSSFTQLLTAESGPNATGVMDCGPAVTSTTDYFGQAGTFGYPCKPQQVAPSYSSMLHFGNSPNRGMGMMPCSSSMAANGEHQELQHFSVIQDHVIPVAAASPARDYYNLNVSISSGFAGFNRGTLQSNSPHHHHLSDGDDLPFFFGAALPVVATAGNSMENQFHVGFNGRLDYYSEARKHPDLKREDKG